MREVAWEYVFVNASDGREVSRHSFVSAVRLRPGRTKELTGFSVRAPSNFVNASAVTPAGEPRLAEKVVIRSLVFDDGSRMSF